MSPTVWYGVHGVVPGVVWYGMVAITSNTMKGKR